MINPATVATTSPTTTGTNDLRTSSITGTRANPATASSDDQAISTPPPDHTQPIWPIAASSAGSTPDVGPSVPASEPVSGSPAKPDPSSPVIMPMIRTPKPTT